MAYLQISADEVELGPAMEALTDKQRKFVRAVRHLGAEHGKINYTQAARLAGYKDAGTSAIKVNASQLARHPKIQAAMREEALTDVGLGAYLATKFVVEIAADKKAKNADRLRAIEMLYVRAGMPAQTEHRLTVEHVNPKKMIDLVIGLARDLDIDPQKLLGGNRDTVDAEFKEVNGHAAAGDIQAGASPEATRVDGGAGG